MKNVTTMSPAPWKTLLKTALQRNRSLRHSKYIQVATVRPDGRPANRTVVFRGFLDDTNHLTFVTDSRSHKVKDLEANPWAEIAWYFTDTREQFRFLGKLTVIGAQHNNDNTNDSPQQDDIDTTTTTTTTITSQQKLAKARVSAWKNMSDPGRQQFTWPFPGIPRPDEDKDDKALFGIPAPTFDDPVSDTFCLVVVDVCEVDHLSLKTNKRQRFEKKVDEEEDKWLQHEVNP